MAQKIQQNPELKDTAIGLAGGGGAVMAGGHACAGDPATKVARELYIGNMSEGTTEISLVTFFNEEMQKRAMVDTSLPGQACIVARINGRFAFVEFRSVDETDKALTLNGAMMNGCSLRVGRPKAYQGPPGSVAATQAALAAAGAQNLMGLSGEDPTVVIQMKEMLTVEELRDSEEYDDIVEDIRGEMEKYGEVESVEVPKPPEDPAAEVPEYVSIVYVKYKEVGGSIKAQLELEGRVFGGNAIQCNFYPEDKFDAKEFVDITNKPEPEAEEMFDPNAPHALPANLLGGAAPVISTDAVVPF